MIQPRITYTDLTGAAVLDFNVPPTGKPAYMGAAQRSDLFSTAGVRQSTVLRTDTKFPISVAAIYDDSSDDAVGNLDDWMRFVLWAQQGGSFMYYPDGTNLELGYQCFMIDTGITLGRVAPGVYTFSATFQEEVLG